MRLAAWLARACWPGLPLRSSRSSMGEHLRLRKRQLNKRQRSARSVRSCARPILAGLLAGLAPQAEAALAAGACTLAPTGSAGAELVGETGDCASESLDESEQSEDSEVEHYWTEIMNSFTKGKGRPTSSPRKTVAASSSVDVSVASSSGDLLGIAASGPGQASGGAPPTSGAPPAPLADVRAAPARRQPMRRDYVPAIGGGSCYFEAYDGVFRQAV